MPPPNQVSRPSGLIVIEPFYTSERQIPVSAGPGQRVRVVDGAERPARVAQPDGDCVFDVDPLASDVSCHRLDLDDLVAGQPEQLVDVVDGQPMQDPAAACLAIEDRIAGISDAAPTRS